MLMGQRLLLLFSVWKKRPLHKTAFSLVIKSITTAITLHFTATFVRILTLSMILTSCLCGVFHWFMVQPKPKAEFSF
jgi:hypothetical protein